MNHSPTYAVTQLNSRGFYVLSGRPSITHPRTRAGNHVAPGAPYDHQPTHRYSISTILFPIVLPPALRE